MAEIDGARLDRLIAARGTSQSEVARAIGVSQPTIGRLISGETRETGKIIELARFLKTTPEYLIGEVESPDLAAPAFAAPEDAAAQLDLVPIDEISLEFGMGATLMDDDHEVVRRYVPADWIAHFTKSHPSLLRFARGRGDSMYPTILDGDLVLIDMGETRLTRQDEIWAVGYGDLGGLKRLRSVGRGTIKVMSDNASVSDEVFGMEEIRLSGRVCGNLRKM
ncbi:XRE family transcriptional regulator [Sphingomonas sp.]|uniref:XRE family transcriptional regulator n=1 Tax=Sphingomonas sp. TaxID=28214 RepID=UPI003F6ED7C8